MTFGKQRRILLTTHDWGVLIGRVRGGGGGDHYNQYEGPSKSGFKWNLHTPESG